MNEPLRTSAEPAATSEPDHAAPGAAAVATVRTMLAQGVPPVAQVAAVLRAAPGDRDAILALLHQTLGNAYVQQVVTQPTAPRPLASVATDFEAAAATVGTGDPARLAGAMRALSAALLAGAHSPTPKQLARLLDTMAAALGKPFTDPADEADAIVDAALEAYDASHSLPIEADALHDDELRRAIDPIVEGLNYLRNFGADHARPRFATDLGAIAKAAQQFLSVAQRASEAGMRPPSGDEQFACFEALYECLVQSQPEVPAAQPLMTALQAIEAALAQQRKPNAYATAAEAPLAAYMQGLDTLARRGPWGTTRVISTIQAPLARGLGWLEARGSVLAGESREGAQDYQRQVDPAEDPAATAALAARHADAMKPPAKDDRIPAPDWAVPLEATTSAWKNDLRSIRHNRAPSSTFEAHTKDLVTQLTAIADVIPNARPLAGQLRDLPTWVGRRDDPQQMLAIVVDNCEAARQAFSTDATAYALRVGGPPTPDANPTLAWLTTIADHIEKGLGWAFVMTDEGERDAFARTERERTIDEWKHPDPPQH